MNGAPVLDIGGDVGAVVVWLSAMTPTGELEAQPIGHPERRFHTGVHWRDAGCNRHAVAVYPEVVAGEYEILDGRMQPVARVRVTGGAVSTLHLD
jgi:hypothetical protein